MDPPVLWGVCCSVCIHAMLCGWELHSAPHGGDPILAPTIWSDRFMHAPRCGHHRAQLQSLLCASGYAINTLYCEVQGSHELQHELLFCLEILQPYNFSAASHHDCRSAYTSNQRL